MATAIADQLAGLLEKEPDLLQDMVSRIDARIQELEATKRALLGHTSVTKVRRTGRKAGKTGKPRKATAARRARVEIDKQEFAGFVKQGYTDAKLAAHYKVSPGTVYNKKKAFGLVGTNKPGRKARKKAPAKRK